MAASRSVVTSALRIHRQDQVTPTSERLKTMIRESQVVAASVLVVAVLLIGCADSSNKIPRNYSRTIQVEGHDVLDVRCEYLGKAPGDHDSYRSSHNFRNIDTDFYKVSFTNRTESDIHIEGVSYRMADGPVRGMSSASPDSIKRTWGTNVIRPGQTISHPNSFVWSKSRTNAMVKQYQFRGIDADGNRMTFTAKLSLAYSR